MGAWGIKNFENDTAIDWLTEFQQEADSVSVEILLDKILKEPDFINDEESYVALGYLELLAINLGLISPTIDINISFHITLNMIEKTIKAAQKILFFENHSELKELWEESEDYLEWQDYQSYLINILRDYHKTIASNVKPNDILSPSNRNSPWLPPDWEKN